MKKLYLIGNHKMNMSVAQLEPYFERLAEVSMNADNVVGLENWLNKNAGTVKGLSENNLTDDAAQKLEELLFISSVNTSQLKVTSGKLEILEVDSSKITGLEDMLNSKVSNATSNLTF